MTVSRTTSMCLSACGLLALLGIVPAGCMKEIVKKVPAPSADGGIGEIDSTGSGDAAAELDAPASFDQAGPETTDSTPGELDHTATPEADVVLEDECLVGPAGRTCVFECGVVLVVPPGAVAEEVLVTLKQSAKQVPDYVLPVSLVWEFGPDGTQFAHSALARLPIIENDLWASQWLDVRGFLEGKAGFEEVPALPDVAAGFTMVPVGHFSAVLAGLKSVEGCSQFELCNGKDDDCDGVTDDEPDKGSFSCPHTGACFGGGIVKEICNDGKWDCDYSLAPVEYQPGSETLCDNIDNDCDGSTDEGIGGTMEALEDLGLSPLCSVKGLCTADKVKAVCGPQGKWICDYSKIAGYQGKTEITCDGIDGNCDGATDEGTCQTFDPCQDDGACLSGHCVLPLHGEDATFCASKPDECLVVSDDQGMAGELLKIVPSGGTWCTLFEGEPAVKECKNGGWGPPYLCWLDFPLNASCDTETMTCVGGCLVVDDCSDNGNLCDGTPMCAMTEGQEFGECKTDFTTIPVCPPAETCVDYKCDPKTGDCQANPKNEGIACDDKDACTLAGQCQAGTCKKGAAVECKDANPCSVGQCDPTNGKCVFSVGELLHAPCNDKDACTTADQCQEDMTCAGEPKFCSDGNPCTTDGCDPMTAACVFTITPGVACDDGDLCTLDGICSPDGKCEAPKENCADVNDCTVDACDKESGDCTHLPVAAGSPCLYPSAEPGQQDTCTPAGDCDASGTCLPGLDLCQCHDDEDCLALDTDLCDGLTECKLSGGLLKCVAKPGTAVSCDPAGDTACSKNLCSPATGQCSLKALADDTPCNDANSCTKQDKCKSGECIGGTQVMCGDDNSCTSDSCKPATGCAYAPLEAGSPCEDGDPCTLTDKCSANGQCAAGPQKNPPCLDGNVCTSDTCTPDGKACIFDPIPGCCKTTEECSVLLDEVCYQNKCCPRACTDGEGKIFQCGDDQCGGQCGFCAGAEICFQHFCCLPNCTAPLKQCGEDGCGGSCGTCGGGAVCTAGFACCVPNCTGKVCGNDGCGGSCGACAAGFICNELNGTCQLCQPQCVGKSCGPNGCGGQCGTCQAGKVCLANGTCCTPSCEGFACGDDGCGGSCGLCSAWETCQEHACVCDVCCSKCEDCGPLETCSGSAGNQGQLKVCEEQLAMFNITFEGEPVGQLSPSFTYSWTSGKFWTVIFSGDGYKAAHGNYSFRFYKAATDSGSFWRDVLFPETGPAQVRVLSFYFMCTSPKVPFTLQAKVNDETVASITQSDCDMGWHRRCADVSGYPPEKTRVKFRMMKNTPEAAEVLLDSVAVLVSDCPGSVPCAKWSETNGICAFGAVSGGKCYIDYACYSDGQLWPQPPAECAVCKPQVSQTQWTADDTKCDDGKPATADICDSKDMTCFHN